MTAFPADAESNLFEGPYPEFSQALAHFAYPGDVRRIRELRSEWRAHNPCEYPPLFDERGWDAPRTGEAFKALWLKLEEGDVRSWRRMGKGGPYEAINPTEWRRGREYAMRQIRPPQPPPGPGFIVVATGPPLVGDVVDRRIPERDFFVVLLVNETFLRDVVVSRDDVLKRASTALAGAVASATESGRRGGKKSGEVRRESRRWVPHAEEIACAVDPNLSNGEIALAISDRWKRADVEFSGAPDANAVCSAAQGGRKTSAAKASIEELKGQIDSIPDTKAFASDTKAFSGQNVFPRQPMFAVK